MWIRKLLALLFLVSAIHAHPLQRRASAIPSSSSSSPSVIRTMTSSVKPTVTTPTMNPSSTSVSLTLKPPSSSSLKSDSTSSTTISTSNASLKPTTTRSPDVPSLQPLFDGNKEFAKNKATSANLTSQQPSYMILGCSDSRPSAETIFHAPVGSMVSQNTIANQYFGKDVNADAAVTYAVENLGIKHIIVLGHYGCKSVEIAINASDKPHNAVEKWVKPITAIFSKSRRAEVKNLRNSRKAHRGQKNQSKVALKADDAGFKAVVEENVKASVRRLQKESYLAKAYQKNGNRDKKNEKKVETYVYGLVYDEASGEVKDLRVSFGPPGKKIPAVPFAAVTATKAQNKAKHLPGFFKGKKLPKKGSVGK